MAGATKYSQERLEFINAVIANGQSESGVIDLVGKIVVALITPAALDGVVFTLKISSDGITFYDYYDILGNLLNITVAPDRWIGFLPVDFANVRYLKFVSDASESAERILKIAARGM